MLKKTKAEECNDIQNLNTDTAIGYHADTGYFCAIVSEPIP